MCIVCAYVLACMCVRMWIWIHTHSRTHTRTHIRKYTLTHMHIRKYTYARTHILTHTRTHMQIHIHTHTHANTHANTLTHTHTYTTHSHYNTRLCDGSEFSIYILTLRHAQSWTWKGLFLLWRLIMPVLYLKSNFHTQLHLSTCVSISKMTISLLTLPCIVCWP